jgi:hypothetical protein
MASLVSCIFVLVVGYNAYYTAKRSGRWSWPQFFVVVAALVVVPILIVVPLANVSWFNDKPGLFTLIVTTLIILFVCALAFALKKYWPLPKKNRS